jgi:hypothetical protein
MADFRWGCRILEEILEWRDSKCFRELFLYCYLTYLALINFLVLKLDAESLIKYYFW